MHAVREWKPDFQSCFLHGITLLFNTSQCIDHFLLKKCSSDERGKVARPLDWLKTKKAINVAYFWWMKAKEISFWFVTSQKEVVFTFRGWEIWGDWRLIYTIQGVVYNLFFYILNLGHEIFRGLSPPPQIWWRRDVWRVVGNGFANTT